MPMLRLLVSVVLLAAPLGPEPRPVHPRDPTLIDRIAWLTGCWARERPGTLIEEHWMAPRGATMLGLGRTTRDGKLVEYEFIRLSERDGHLAYEAHPSGQASTTFRSSTLTDTMVVFSDPAHDFPQAVGYRRLGSDSLLAWIEGTVNGRSRRIDFPYRRVPCVVT
ncbi:MAG: DUF6265 family protein [Gemmatimonadales bacterium]